MDHGKNNFYKAEIAGAEGVRTEDKDDADRAPYLYSSITSRLKPKDLIGLPWRVAFALQTDGWYLRSCLPWLKRNPMPESTEDRPTTAHEFVFLLTKAARYFYDTFAVRRIGTSGPSDSRKMEESRDRIGGKHKSLDDQLNKASAATNIGNKRAVGSPMRQWRTMDPWLDSIRAILDGGEGLLSDENGDPLALAINTEPFAGSHFAVFPPSLVSPMILAGTSERGACPRCGAPWERVVDRAVPTDPGRGESKLRDAKGLSARAASTAQRRLGQAYQDQLNANPSKTSGWHPTCRCGLPEADNVPCRVFDPFAGSGTVPMVAQNLGRVGIGVELKPEYLAMAAKRTRQGALL